MGNGSTPTRAGRLATSGILALASAGLLTGALLAAGSEAAGASTVSATIPYSCSIAGLITETLNIQITATAPASVAPGGQVSLTGVQGTTQISPTLINQLFAVLDPTAKKGATLNVAGTVTTFLFNATNATGSANLAAPGYSFSVPVKNGQTTPANITVPPSPTTVGPFTAGSSGSLSIVPGNVLVKAKAGTVSCTAPSSIPAAATISVPISASGGTGTTTSSSGKSTVPSSHTGEPWAGWPYWMIVALLGLVGLGTLERAARIRRHKV